MKKFITAYHSVSTLNGQNPIDVQNRSTPVELVEPEYTKLIDIKIMRRMSKFLQMGVFSAMSCLEGYNANRLNGFITATGLGCIADTQIFLNNLIQREEYLLTPTSFIQSTHNTLAGTLGIMTGNNCYNNTWSQREMSFTCAMEDVFGKKDPDHNGYLVVAADEMPPGIQDLLNRIPTCSNNNNWSEGAAAFLIHDQPLTENSIEMTLDIKPNDDAEVQRWIEKSPESFFINTNEAVKEFVSPNSFIDLTKAIGRCFINDALGLAWACDLLQDKSNETKHVTLLAGDDSFLTVFQLRLV